MLSAGKTIGRYDLLIAAHARQIDAVLVTNNEREFKRVPGLSLQNWAQERIKDGNIRRGG